MERALVDTGIYYAVFDSKDPYYDQVQPKADYLDLIEIVLPWPVLYETLSTAFVRNAKALRLFETYITKPHVIFLDDSPYRDAALELSIDSSLRRSRPLSLVDCILRLMLDDQNIKIDYLFTLNVGDFEDVCRRRFIEIL
jgi:predicted nucleic acid-binding protein